MSAAVRACIPCTGPAGSWRARWRSPFPTCGEKKTQKQIIWRRRLFGRNHESIIQPPECERPFPEAFQIAQASPAACQRSCSPAKGSHVTFSLRNSMPPSPLMPTFVGCGGSHDCGGIANRLLLTTHTGKPLPDCESQAKDEPRVFERGFLFLGIVTQASVQPTDANLEHQTTPLNRKVRDRMGHPPSRLSATGLQ